MSIPGYQLVLKISTPKVADEDKNCPIEYIVKNTGHSDFPGGQIVVEISWEKSKHKVRQSVPITKILIPGAETEIIKRSQKPLTRDYTWFYIHQAIASDGKPIQLLKKDMSTILWPHIVVSQGPPTIVSRQALHAVRTRTIEEKGRALTQWLTVIALLAVVGLQVIDWILQY